jgi:hydroxylysine kinase
MNDQSLSPTDALGAELNTGAEAVSPVEATAIAKDHYGFDGEVEWLWGEKDSNYRLALADGREYLLKILNPGEDPKMSDMHSQALLHVEKTDPSIPCQRIIPTKSGAADFRYLAKDSSERAVRMVSFVPGKGQRTYPHSKSQRHQVGVLLAKMQNALASFSHEAAHHKITWDMKHASGMRALLPAIEEGERRKRLTAAIDDFDANVMPRLNDLPAQTIHNDFNMENILIDPENPDQITGIIDFGDMVHGPTVFDVAVAAAYQQGNEEDPIQAICDVLEGYKTLRSLSDLELEVLYPTVIMRGVMRIAIPMSRAMLFPDQRERFVVNVETVWKQIERVDQIERSQAIARFKAAMK